MIAAEAARQTITLRLPRLSVIRGAWAVVAAGIALGLLHLWIHSRVIETSGRIKTLEIKTRLLDEHLGALQVKLARLTDPAVVKARLEESRSGLVIPRSEQIVRIGPAAGGALADRETVIVSMAH